MTDVSIFSLSSYFKQIVYQLYKVILTLDKFFFKYEGGAQFDPRKNLPPTSSALLGLKKCSVSMKTSANVTSSLLVVLGR